MSSPPQGKPPTGLTPPPLPARAQKERARVRRRPGSKPPPIEFLSEEFVQEDVQGDIEACEELPDEFVVEEQSNVGFAGPSDVPPRPDPPASPPTAIQGAPPPQAVGNPRQGRSVRTALLYAAVAVALLVAIGWSIGSAPSRTRIALADSAAASPSASPPVTEDPQSNFVSTTSPAALTSALPWVSEDFPSAEAGGPPAHIPVKAAIDARDSSQQALEQGKVVVAIELGEHAVELDPADADSWLILGAAYMQRADNKNARRCFASCVKQATVGAKKECAAMLR